MSLSYSKKDKKLYVIRGGFTMVEADLKTNFFKYQERGTTTFICVGWKNDTKEENPESDWVAVGGYSSHQVKPGVVMVITGEPVIRHTRSNPSFTVLQSRWVENEE